MSKDNIGPKPIYAVWLTQAEAARIIMVSDSYGLLGSVVDSIRAACTAKPDDDKLKQFFAEQDKFDQAVALNRLWRRERSSDSHV